MPDPRKVYIASRKDPETRKMAFELVRKEFLTAERADEAEFIILDCDDPAAFREWVSNKPRFVVHGTCYPPIVLASLGGKDPAGFLERLSETYDGDVSVLPVCDTPDELLRTLKRLQAALPFYNRRNAPEEEDEEAKEARKMALSIVKAALEGRNE